VCFCCLCPKDHVFGVGIEFGSFNMLGSRVLGQNPKKRRELA